MLTALLNNKYLIRELVARDVHTRYVGSLVGVFWSVLNPLLQLILYTIIFAGVLEQRFDEKGTTGRFALYLFCALLPWMAVQEAVSRSARSFIENSNLIKKIRFPLEVLPMGNVLSALVHQCLGTAILVVALVIDRSMNYRALPLLLLLLAFQLSMMYGLSLAVACLNVFIRDVAQILGVVFMLFFWITPIVYPRTRAPGASVWILNLNPLTHMVEAYRFVFLGNPVPSTPGVVYWVLFSIGAPLFGAFILKRTRRDLVDLI